MRLSFTLFLSSTSLVLKFFLCFSLVLTSIQNEDVSIVVVGILGKQWEKKEYRNKMKEMAGKKGKVLRYPDFEILTKLFNEVLDALCRKYFFFSLADFSKTMLRQMRTK